MKHDRQKTTPALSTLSVLLLITATVTGQAHAAAKGTPKQSATMGCSALESLYDLQTSLWETSVSKAFYFDDPNTFVQIRKNTICEMPQTARGRPLYNLLKFRNRDINVHFRGVVDSHQSVMELCPNTEITGPNRKLTDTMKIYAEKLCNAGAAKRRTRINQSKTTQK
jgi:hypothetical protein